MKPWWELMMPWWEWKNQLSLTSRDEKMWLPDNDKMIAAYDIRWELMKPWWELMMPWSEWKKSTFFDVTWRKHVTSYVRRRFFRSGFRQRTFCNQLEVSTTYDAKVMDHYVFFIFGVILTLTFDLSRSLFLCGVNIVSTKKYWTFSVAEFLWYDCTLKKQCTICVTLTYDLWRSIICCELIISL